MPHVRKCLVCGQPFVLRNHHFNQRYCSVSCSMKARNKRVRERKFGKSAKIVTVSSVNRASEGFCRELWKQYKEFKRLIWIDEKAKIERQLKEKGCWFKHGFHLTKYEKQLGSENDKEVA